MGFKKSNTRNTSLQYGIRMTEEILV